MREIFSDQGTVTDVQLKYTKDGVFRQFAFVGYQNEEQAAAATTHFHRSCIQTNRITVEPCVALGAEAKPKSWSKYSADSSAFQKANAVPSPTEDVVSVKKTRNGEQTKNKKKQPSAVDELLAQHKDDPQFVEFMKMHAKGKGIWENDWETEEKENEAAAGDKDDVDAGSGNEALDVATKPEENEAQEEPKPDPVKLADQDISDAEYLKLLKQKKQAIDDKQDPTKSTKGRQPATAATVKTDPAKLADLLTIKIRNIPFKTKRQDVLTFFKPLKPFSVRLPTQVHGICYVGFKTETDFKKAMLKNRSFWSKIHLQMQ